MSSFWVRLGASAVFIVGLAGMFYGFYENDTDLIVFGGFLAILGRLTVLEVRG